MARHLLDILESVSRKDWVYNGFGGQGRLEKTAQLIQTLDEQSNPADDHLFTRIKDESGEAAALRMGTLTQEWNKGNRPSLYAVADAWLDILGYDKDEPFSCLLLLVAARAEITNGRDPLQSSDEYYPPAYHNQVHFMQVFQSVCYMIQSLDEFPEMALVDKRNRLKVMISAMAHDVDHPGGGNPWSPLEKNFKNFVNEDTSIIRLRPIVNGVFGIRRGNDVILSMQSDNRFTDVSGPHKDLKQFMERFRENGSLPVTAPSYHIRYPADLLRAALLQDADILASAGMGQDLFEENGRKLTEEFLLAGVPCDMTSPRSMEFFFNDIVTEAGFLTHPAQSIFGKNCERLRCSILPSPQQNYG